MALAIKSTNSSACVTRYSRGLGPGADRKEAFPTGLRTSTPREGVESPGKEETTQAGTGSRAPGASRLQRAYAETVYQNYNTHHASRCYAHDSALLICSLIRVRRA